MSDLKVTWQLPQVFSPPPICPIFRVLSISRTSPCTNDSSLARNNLRDVSRDLQQQQKNVLTDIESEGTTITNARWILYFHNHFCPGSMDPKLLRAALMVLNCWVSFD